MRKLLFFLIHMLVSWPTFAQENDPFYKQQLSADFGSFRNRYFYPITDLKYNSAPLIGERIKFSGRLRSYGTLFFFSRSSYDLTPIADYFFRRDDKKFFFSIGAGFDARIRLVNDERSEAASSVEPLLSFSGYYTHGKLQLSIPLWTRFYANGISFTILPEISCQINERFSLFLRLERSFLKVYKTSDHEWRKDGFLGIQYGF